MGKFTFYEIIEFVTIQNHFTKAVWKDSQVILDSCIF